MISLFKLMLIYQLFNLIQRFIFEVTVCSKLHNIHSESALIFNFIYFLLHFPFKLKLYL